MKQSLKNLSTLVVVAIAIVGFILLAIYGMATSGDDEYYEDDYGTETQKLRDGRYDEYGQYHSYRQPSEETDAQYQARLEKMKTPLTVETARPIYQNAYAYWQRCGPNRDKFENHCPPGESIVVDFGRVMMVLPETEKDFRAAWEMWPSGQLAVAKELIDFYRLPSDRFRRELEEVRATRLAQIRSTGFDPTKSYRSPDGSKLDPPVPFDRGCGSCNDLKSEQLEEMVWLCHALGLSDKKLVWKRHLADYYWTEHGYYGSRAPELAAQIYRELGDEEKADLAHQVALRGETRVPINRFLYGLEDPDGGTGEWNRPVPQYQLEDLEKVYGLLTEAKASTGEIHKEILPLVEAAVAAEQFEVAKRGYELLGDLENTTRMAFLTSP